MSTYTRRLDRLEEQYRPVDPAHDLQRAWLETRADRELELLEEALAHIEAGGDPGTLPETIRAPYLALTAAWEQFCEERS